MTDSAFKNVFNHELVATLASKIQRVYPEFKKNEFADQINKSLTDLEMKARAQLIATTLKEFLPSNYKESVKILLSTLGPALPDKKGVFGIKPEVWMMWPINIFVQENGLDDLETSMAAMYELTQRFSCEFAIRPFINKYPKEVFEYFQSWVVDSSPHVRRLVSEGTRPFLPWGIKLDMTDKNPDLVLPLLSQLRDDESEYVRISVANHLNDLTRNNCDLILEELSKWKQGGWQNEPKMSKKALRNLIKQGNQGAMKYFGFHKPQVDIKQIQITPDKIKIGEEIEFSCTLKNQSTSAQLLQIDYVVGYVKASGKQSPKVFKLKTIELGNEPLKITKKQSFKNKSIRKHYTGTHSIALQINGQQFPLGDIDIQDPT